VKPIAEKFIKMLRSELIWTHKGITRSEMARYWTASQNYWVCAKRWYW